MGLIEVVQMRLSPQDLADIAAAVASARLDTRVLDVAGHRVLLRLKPLNKGVSAENAAIENRELQIIEIESLSGNTVAKAFGLAGPPRPIINAA